MKAYQTIKTLLLVTVAATALTLKGAQANTLDYSSFEQLFGESVTTGTTGIPMRASDSSLSIEIITAEDIRRMPARDIPDILKHYTGVSSQRSAAMSSNVSIRGYNRPYAERLLVLLDGREIYISHQGYVDWGSIPVQLSEIKQIEVIRGPNTALYGFHAVAGVINIITFNPLYDKKSNISADIGNDGYRRASWVQSLNVSKDIALRVAGAGAGSDEFNDGFEPLNIGIGQLYDEDAIKTDPRTNSMRVMGGWQINDTTQANIELARGYADVTQAGANRIDHERHEVKSGKVSFSSETKYGLIEGKVYKNLNSIYVQQVRNIFAGGGLVSQDALNTLTVASLSDVFKVGTDHTIRLVGEWRRIGNQLFVANPNADFQIDVAAAGVTWGWQATDKLSLTNAVRADRVETERTGPIGAGAIVPFTNADFDNSFTEYSVNSSAAYKLTERDIMRASFARAIDLPTVAEYAIEVVTGAPPNAYLGDPDIKTAVVHHYELGYEHKFDKYDTRLKTAVFTQNSKGMQGQVVTVGQTTFAGNYINSNSFGGEVSATSTFNDNWKAGLGYSYVKIDDKYRNAAVIEKYEDRAPRSTVNGHLGYTKGPWTADGYALWTTNFRGARSTTTNRTVEGNVITDMRVGYKVNDAVEFSVNGVGVFEDSWEENNDLDAERRFFARMDVDLGKLPEVPIPAFAKK